MAMKAKVFIVDDDPVMGKLMKFRLTQAGYGSWFFQNARDALHQVNKLLPDIIVSDITMPDMDGYQFQEQLRQDPQTASIPFIFLTAKSGTMEQLEGLRLGADDYVCKPVSFELFVERMERVLERAAKARAYQAVADFSGNLNQMNLNDIVQIVESNNKEGVLVLHSHEDENPGQIYFKDGMLVNAQIGPLEGEEAFYEMLSKQDGRFEFFSKKVNEKKTIHMSNMAALLHGIRLVDEAKSLRRYFPIMNKTLTIVNNQLPQEVQEDLGNEFVESILMLIESRRTVGEILDSSIMSCIRAGAILIQLAKAGIVVPSKETNHLLKFKPDVIDDWLLEVLKRSKRRSLTGVLKIKDRKEVQYIYFSQGSIVHAIHGDTIGKKALYRIFFDKGGSPHFEIKSIININHSIDAPLNVLLEEGCREVDALRSLKPGTLDNMVQIRNDIPDDIQRILNHPILSETIHLIKKHRIISKIMDACSLTDFQTYRQLLYLLKINYLKLKVKKGFIAT